MLERLLIERFKSIRSADVSFGQVNLFIGANGAGKSNLLEAIGIVSAMVGRGVGNSDLARKGVRLTPPEMMKSAHKYRDLPKTLELTAFLSNSVCYKCNLSSSLGDASLKVHSESLSVQNRRLFGRSARGTKLAGLSVAGTLERQRGVFDQVKAVYAFPSAIQEALESFARYAIYAPQTDFLRGRKSARPEDPPIGLHGEGLPDAVWDLIRQVYGSRASDTESKKQERELARNALNLVYLPGWTRGVRVGLLDRHMVSSDVSNESERMVYFVDKFMRDERNKLSAYDSSEGTLFLLFAAVLLAHRNAPKFFALDNVDSALNPAMTRTLVERIIEITVASNDQALDVGPKQVFLTSHNPTSLDAFDLFDEKQRAFVVSRDPESGDTNITRLVPKSGMTKVDWAIATNGKKLSQIWLDGSIQGLSQQNGLF